MVQREEGKVRNSSIELLRIISMLMIVFCHFATHGGFSFDESSVTIPRLWWSFIEMGGNFGVDVFVLISGYFLVASKGTSLNFKKIVKFWGQVFVYSILIYALSCAFGVSSFSAIECIKAFFPITFEAWWFASTYFVLYLIHPFINMLLQKLDRRTYEILIVSLFILWCLIPTFTNSAFQSNKLLWFITLYSFAGYVRLYGLNEKLTGKHYVIIWLVFSALRYLSCVALIVIGTKYHIASEHSLYFYKQQSVLTFVSALALFMAFEKTQIGYSKIINTIASATFGVYLIHDNNIIRPLIWQDLFKNSRYQDSAFIIPYSIIVVIAIFVVCSLIDLLRQILIERPFMLLVTRYSERLIKPWKSLYSVVTKLVFGEKE